MEKIKRFFKNLGTGFIILTKVASVFWVLTQPVMIVLKAFRLLKATWLQTFYPTGILIVFLLVGVLIIFAENQDEEK